VSRIKARGGRAAAVKADASKLPDIRRLFDSAVTEFGKVDVLVNNAGVYEPRSLEVVDESHFDREFGVNVKGLYFAAQAAAQAFGGRGGSIVNISSVASLSPRANLSVYSATKAVVDAFTQSLASELGQKKIGQLDSSRGDRDGRIRCNGRLSPDEAVRDFANATRETRRASRYRQRSCLSGIRQGRLDHGPVDSGYRAAFAN
jgi:NAD(P)-dependent dehydrogenase (short-subunit alcohol dehydrogenase family)